MPRTVASAKGSTKQRFVASACRLFQEKGYEATSVGEIAKAGSLPIGSLYYHFPEGKEQLAVAAVEHGATDFIDILQEGMSRGDEAGEALRLTALYLADRLEASQWVDGCPVAAVALETVTGSPVLRVATATALQQWVDVVAERLMELDVSTNEASEIASVVISILEGAELMARVAGSRAPLEAAANRMPYLLAGPKR